MGLRIKQLLQEPKKGKPPPAYQSRAKPVRNESRFNQNKPRSKDIPIYQSIPITEMAEEKKPTRKVEE